MTEPTFKPDMELLVEAFDNNSDEWLFRYFLDRRTGAVLSFDCDLLEAVEDGEDPATFASDVAEDAAAALPVVKDTEGRYLEVMGEGSRPVFDDMLDFTATVTKPQLRAALEHALNERRPFRRFKDAMGDDATELERWYAYRDERRRDRVRQWLRDSGLPQS